MTTKGLIVGEGIRLRSSRRLCALPPILPSCPPLASSYLDSQLSDSIPRAIDPEELHPKIEKQSTSPQRATRSPVCRPTRPVTRSHVGVAGKATIEEAEGLPDVQLESVWKKEESIPMKKEKQVLKCNNSQSSDQPLVPIDPLPHQSWRKTTWKPSSMQTTHCPGVFGSFRKSYRKISRGEVVSFPYRKCHDALEGRIITVLNKLSGDKDCKKEMEGLADRVAKATSRQIKNRFVVAGLRMVIRLAKEKDRQNAAIDPRLLSRLQAEEKALQGRISEQLSNFDQYEEISMTMTNHSPDPSAGSYRALVMKKLYSAFKKTQPNRSKGEIRKRVINECQGFFAGEVSMKEMLSFVKKKLEE